MAFSDAGIPDIRSRVAEVGSAADVNVLHVDDDEEFLDLAGIYLEKESPEIDVTTRTSAAAGLAYLRENDVDCVVSDYDMPGTDGLEFLEAVREESPDLPFVLFTGKGSEEIASEAITAGVTEYLQKGVGTDQYAVLANRITNAVVRRRVEREVERGFKAIETAREGISFLDEQGRFEYVNEAYADVFGYDRDELLGEHWEVLYPEDHVEQIYDEILPAVPETGRWSGESVNVAKDGTRLVVDHALAYADDGRLLCLIQDITERKEREQALRRERRRFELFVEAVEEYAIVALDAEGFLTSWNRGAERLYGYGREDVVGDHVSVLVPDGADVDPDAVLAEAVERGSAERRSVRRRADGESFRADVLTTAVRDGDGTGQGFLEIARDRSGSSPDPEDAGIESVDIGAALDVLDDLFYVLDEDGRIVHVSQGATEVTGYSREALRSMEATDLFPPDERDRIRADVAEALRDGSSTVEADLLTKDGRRLPYEFRKKRLTGTDGRTLLAGVGRNVSERTRRERRLERQSMQFEHFADVVSHDLRTPLNTAMGYLDLAEERGDADDFATARRALDRLEELIADLSEVMRDGELVGEERPVDVAAAASEVWDSLDTASATLTVASGATIDADEESLKRLLENLLKNAIEHAGDDVSVTVGALPDGFYVADDGPGIAGDDADSVFVAGASSKGAGGGFGLVSARQIAFAHGWDIGVAPNADGGARFEVTGATRVE